MRTGGLAVLAWALALAGCSPGGPEGPAVTGPPAALREGTIVRGSLVESTEFLGGDRLRLREPLVSRHPLAARLQDGRARLDGVSYATRRGLAQARHEFDVRDAERRPARVVVLAPAAGLPASRIEVYRDGQLLASTALDWARVVDGWTLRSRTLTMYENGRPVLRHVREVEGTSLTISHRGGFRAGIIPGLAASVLPARLEAQRLPFSCVDEAVMTVVAAAGVGAATAAAIATPNPLTIGALVTAIAFYDKTMGALESCIIHVLDDGSGM